MERIKWEPIRPGIVIGCRNEKETMALMEHLEKLGFHWITGQRPMVWKPIKPFEAFSIGGSKCILLGDTNKVNIMFSDLMEKEEIHPSVPLQPTEPDKTQTFPDSFLKWKKIIPGMIIACQNELEVRALLRHLEKLGYRWKSGQCPTEGKAAEAAECFRTFRLYEDGTIVWCPNSYANIGFIDLIEQETEDDCKTEKGTPDTSELSAKEILEWLTTYQGTNMAKKCFGDPCDIKSILGKFTPEEIIGKISAFETAKREKADDPETKEPESEDVALTDPELAEVESGFHCVICKGISSNAIAEQYNLWGVSYAYAWSSAWSSARKWTDEHGGEYSAKIWPICRRKNKEK